MLKHMRTSTIALVVVMISISAALIISGCAEKEPVWKAVNDKVIAEQNVPQRPRTDITTPDIVSNLEPAGVVQKLDTLGDVQIAQGVVGNMYWSKGNLINWMKLEPGAEIAKETLPGDRVLVVWEGSVEQLINGQMVEMIAIQAVPIDGTHGSTPRKDIVYLEQGADNAMKAGPNGAYVLEASWPVRLDYLEKAGVQDIPSNVPKGTYPVSTSIEANKVIDYYDIQFTELIKGANSRIISLGGMQLSFIRMDPGSVFDYHNHPEGQVMIALRGWIDELIMDGTSRMEKGATLLLPGQMVHGGTNGPMGCDALDVFWPARVDYDEKMQDRLAGYHAIIPRDAKVELVADGAVDGPGITFGEGPSWINGKLYFSSMHFEQSWAGDPKKSSLIEMNPDGSYKHIIHGKMQTNGTMPMRNGNLAVCDMFGHRIIEVTTKGRIVRTLANKFDGKSIDGPNDLVIDAKDGIYFTDPQFTPDAEKNQPGRSVYYRQPNGKVIRVIDPNVFAMPNGVLLSPDGKILYVNNTYDDESWWNVDSDKDNCVWAYDVNDDGTLANGRKFGELYLTPDVLDRKGKSTSADGMTIDTEGNLYVATQIGMQILNKNGEFVGIINYPVMPVSCCFGGPDMKTLYATCFDKVYSIKTNMTGVTYPLGM